VVFGLGLLLIWVGATAFGVLVLARRRWHGLTHRSRVGIEAVCLFLGAAGVIGGLSVMAMRISG